MAKLLRLWEKKRGDRRTGSRVVGSLGEALFFGILFLLGIVPLTVLLTAQVLEPTPVLYTIGVGFWLLVIVLSSFVLIGGGGFIFAVLNLGTSAERRSVLARRAASLPLLSGHGSRREAFPAVPSDANLTNSPGTTLAFRLPTTQSPAWRLLAAAIFCLFWNAIAILLVVLAVQYFRVGRADLILSLLVIPFIAIGIWATYYLVRQMLIHTGMGPTHMEISAHPFYPGGEYEFCLSQSGRLEFHFLQVGLVCEEVATFQQGTDIREESCRVFQQNLFRREAFRVEWGIPFEYRGRIQIPYGVMHSFDSGHNAVQWSLLVEGQTRAWPRFTRRFPVVVYPDIRPGEDG